MFKRKLLKEIEVNGIIELENTELNHWFVFISLEKS